MPRVSVFNSPLLLGFDEIEQILERISRSGDDGYPPYNIERLEPSKQGERIRITLAVAGFGPDELDISITDNQLTIRGKRAEDGERSYLHRGIAARQFQRAFVLADGMDVESADLENGILSLRLLRPTPETLIRKIKINANGA